MLHPVSALLALKHVRKQSFQKMGVKAGKKRKRAEKEESSDDEESVELPPPTRSSDDPIPRKAKWINKQRVLVFAARGISYRDRHLMTDLRNIMPHSRPENKFDRKEKLFAVNEVCEMKNCNKAILLEGRRRTDLYMWLANVPSGPSAKFLVENIYTMAEMKLTGNCLRHSRPLLSFHPDFDTEPHYKIMKELLIQIFGTPNGHPKSQPFIDHVLAFSIFDNRIWFRNYQILSEDGALAEIGPRFALNPIKIFTGSFGGSTLWENPHYVSPGKHRKLINSDAASKYVSRITQKTHNELDRPETTYALNEIDDIFAGESFATAKDIIEKQAKEELAQESRPPSKKKAKKPKIDKVSVPAVSNGKSPNGKSPQGMAIKGKKVKNHKVAAIKLKKAKAKAKAKANAKANA